MSNLKLINMRDVEVEPICWLWYPFIPYGKVTIIQGDPGEGKTTLVLQIIARLTKGESIIDENKNLPINVIYQTGRGRIGGHDKTTVVGCKCGLLKSACD